MCSKATEIQESWKSNQGDFISSKVYKKVMVAVTDYEWDKEDGIWLPRQDQLQDMARNVVCYDKTFYSLLMIFSNVVDNDVDDIYKNHYSMERLWLGFVMSKIFMKEWNGSEWIKT